MARAKGILEFEGTVGNVIFYYRDGKLLARARPTKKKNASRKSAQSTRENNSEFKGATAASKIMRQGLGPFIKQFADWNISGRLNGIFRNVIGQSDGVRGERPMDLKSAKYLLTDFDLHKVVAFDSIFSALFTVDFNQEMHEVSLHIPVLTPSIMVKAPSGATHFRLVNALVVVPKLVYDPAAKQYFPATGQADVLHSHAYSDYFIYDDASLSDIFLRSCCLMVMLSPMIYCCLLSGIGVLSKGRR